MRRTLSVLLVALFLAAVGVAGADGILIPGPPTDIFPDEPYFTVKYHHVTCDVQDQVATTRVDQVFVNEGRREMEATYLFPLPAGAVVQNFKLTADGQDITAKLLTKEEAQRIYEDIVRRRRDPALLTYAGNNAYQARIFPIPIGGERRIELSYTQLLPYDGGTVEYLYPLSTEKFSPKPIQSVTFVADLNTTRPIGSVYSPSHDVSVNRLSETHVRLSYEENDAKPNRDLLFSYNMATDPVGLSLVTFKEPGQDGFFLLLAAPTTEEDPAHVVPKRVCFVLDTSGSMSGEKIKQAQDALTFCVNSLHAEDRFNVVAFSDELHELAPEPLPAGPAEVERARQFIQDLEANGGTDLDSALRAALRHCRGEGPAYLVFLTDGQPTVGETDAEAILKAFAAEQERLAAGNVRLFVFGVGYDVNTNFLDSLAQGHGGLTTYVRPTESIEAKVSSFYRKIAQPMLTDLSLDFGPVETYDSFPRDLPDLFHGAQLELMGRYRGATTGSATVVLKGSGSQGPQRYELACAFPAESPGRDYLAALWASRKIGYLLDQIRLHGQSEELVNEIVRLSLQYGILTEYTAFLAQETEALPLREAEARAGAAMGAGFGAGPAGPGATSRSQNAQNLQMQTNVGQTNQYLDEAGKLQQVENVQNVGQRGYVQRQGRWEDTRLQPGQTVALRVQAYSRAYFQLSEAFPQLNSQMAVGDRALLLLGDQLVEVGPEGETELTDAQLQALGAAAGVGPAGNAQRAPGAGAGALAWLGSLVTWLRAGA